ncbi:MAG TPA: roadblock/LC7 domain-containing protein [Geopsychrobacteraceae bacterium]|jgi:predicted regulator of Ras-like GTPase activity (Roadblock/LC7/MglB family)
MFKQILENMVTATPGGVGAVLMGYDGIAIEQYVAAGDDVDLQLVAIEYSNVVKEIRNTSEILGTGELQEVSIKTGRFFVVLHAVTPEYFVALTLTRDGNFGKGRYLLMRDTPRLREALA